MIYKNRTQKTILEDLPEIAGFIPRDFKLNADLLEWKLRFAQKKEDDPIKEIIQSSIQASCTVIVAGKGERWTGSGFHVGNGIIVTASHVAPPNVPIEITLSFDSKTLYKASLLISDPNIDVALLYCPEIKDLIVPVKLADSDTVEIAEIVACIGSPEGWNDTATVGRVSNIHQGLGQYAPSPAWNDIIFIDADILQGSSGGMVIGTDGLVIGHSMGMTGMNAQIGVGERAVCPSNKIKKLLESL